MRLRAWIFIQYFDLETSGFIRFVSDKSEIKPWALGDAVAASLIVVIRRGRAGDDPKGWSLRAKGFSRADSTTPTPLAGLSQHCEIGPTSGLEHSCTQRELLHCGVFYPGDDPSEKWRCGAQQKGKATPVSALAATPQLPAAPARPTGCHTTAFQQAHLGFILLWDWEW